MKSQKTLYNRLTSRHQLVIRNEENFAQKFSLSFTYAKVILLSFLFLAVMLLLALTLSESILERYYNPNYQQQIRQGQLIELMQSLDSMNDLMQKNRVYTHTFREIVKGNEEVINEPIQELSEMSADEQVRRMNQEVDLSEYAEVDSIFRAQIEEDDPRLPQALSEIRGAELQETYFFSPLTGIVSSPYSPKTGHFGVDVVTRPSEPIKCVADGTVLMADWTQNDGYVIAIQHRNNIISVYKHNSEILKKVGNFVSAGDVIAIVGNTGELSEGPHLHLEIWYNGNPVDPQEFVAF